MRSGVPLFESFIGVSIPRSLTSVPKNPLRAVASALSTLCPRPNSRMTRTERLHQSGIIRLGSPKSGFRYKHSDGRKVKAVDLKRIQALAIPPAWSDVAINASAGGQLQAVGKDVAGRWQYRYHENHTRAQELKKFKRVIKFAESIPKLRATISRHLRQPGLGRERVLAQSFASSTLHATRQPVYARKR